MWRARRRSGAGVVLAIATGTSACALLTDLDHFDDPVTTLDGSSTFDSSAATSDAPPSLFDAARPPSPPCSAFDAATLLCDDFERDVPFAGAWTGENRPPNGVLLAIERGASGDRYLHASTPRIETGGGAGEPHLRWESGTPLSKLYVAFDLAILFVPSSGRQLMLIKLDTAPPTQLYVHADGAVTITQQVVGGAIREHGLTPTVTTGVFHRYELSLDLVAGTLGTSIDGRVVVDAPLLPDFAPAPVTLSCGIRFGNLPSDPLDVRIDDYVAVGHP